MHRNSWIIDVAHLGHKAIVADINAIRRYNPQRFEMEQLTAIVYEDASRHICVGYKDLTENEWWIRGHIPSLPAMPMPLMCEAAAQLVNYYVLKHELCVPPGCLLGLRQARCRRLVGPGQRLFVVARLLRVHIAQVAAQFQCISGQYLACDGILVGGVLASKKEPQQPIFPTACGDGNRR